MLVGAGNRSTFVCGGADVQSFAEVVQALNLCTCNGTQLNCAIDDGSLAILCPNTTIIFGELDTFLKECSNLIDIFNTQQLLQPQLIRIIWIIQVGFFCAIGDSIKRKRVKIGFSSSATSTNAYFVELESALSKSKGSFDELLVDAAVLGTEVGARHQRGRRCHDDGRCTFS